METIELVDLARRVTEIAGISVILLGSLSATLLFFRHLWRARSRRSAFRVYRQQVGQSVLLGLEFLVAADIIRSVALAPSFTSIGILAGIVLIRKFLSFTLELEIEGHWPWQRDPSTRSRVDLAEQDADRTNEMPPR